MCNPKFMCDRHLLGEHVEHHMFHGTIKKKKSLSGYIKNNLLEPKSLKDRHDEIVKEMKSRKMNHNSSFDFSVEEISYIGNQINAKIDRVSALSDLIKRCPACNARYQQHKGNS